MTSLTESDKERILAILNSWHKIEFFIPFDLDRSVIQDTHQYKKANWLHEDALLQGENIFNFPNCSDGKVPRYSLFLGVFDKNELAPICDKALELDSPSNDIYENTERGDLEGPTCFARIKLNDFGEPLYDEISISTLPWALGTIQRSGLEGLNANDFALAQGRLVEKLQNLANQREITDIPLPLTAQDVFDLCDLLYDWAQFTPENIIAPAVIQWQESYEKTDETDEEDTEDDGQDGDDQNEPEVDILNSFFIQDIERAMRQVQAARISRSLYEYLTPHSPSKRVDLYSEEGPGVLQQKLHPGKFNQGHWPDTPEHLMSLMQQFAINMAFEANEKTGIFSVNGPPGTGKTTLLRDLIAENIVRRAKVLASCRTASSAFDGRKQLPLENGIWARTLRPELTGFEMVVASSNNAAVNNISKELPKTKSLGECWREQTYIQPTAQKIATKNKDNKFTPLPPDESQWGLIACALGNYINRKKFNEGFAFYPDKNNKAPAHKLGLFNIYDWIKKYSGPTFDEARDTFLSKQKIVDDEFEIRTAFADLVEELTGQTEETYIGAALQDVERYKEELTRIKKDISESNEQVAEIQRAIHLAENDRLVLDRQRPGWFSRLFRLPSTRNYLSAARVLESRQKSLEANITAVKSRLDSLQDQKTWANDQYQKASGRLAKLRQEWISKQERLVEFKKRFSDIAIPRTPEILETDEYQLRGLWNDRRLSTLRTELLCAALSLHEAWLADVGKSKINGGTAGFAGNIMAISSYLKGHTRLEAQDALTIWQSLFMIVPVVSTTFASFAKQFKDVGPNSLGWLFIDEAGQAVPQAAVGALWRAQNAVVVGDPLQIEPVFTVPANLIRSIASLSSHTSEGDYAPDSVSAQNLADACNQYGTYASSSEGESKTWIGSPLRVHRRCIEPMFSVSNNIAYEGKMIYGLPHKSVPDIPPVPVESSWVHIPGETSRQQVVPGQIEFVVKLIITSFVQYGELPAIYVISPFKAIKKQLQKKMKGDWAIYGATTKPSKRTVNDWCKDRIGTVHTFQGKEEDCVIMILGADSHSKIGAAQWVASKPNLLNVAITRAKKRCFIVGDKNLWAQMRYFPTALRHFNLSTPEGVLERLIQKDSS
ncbi:DEAD/DEAH box helicase [Desulfovibrio oxyclinae]|uniref:DEAD/DEAH box helicase n=1 Tax=Desulfovibrio oxyclinae TaxID=63560 RepID=UPI00036BD02B|nr:ATP-binding protein [Desulfovibrio oxyclinae]